MKISQIINETTTAGAVATVSKPLGEVQKRPNVSGLQPAEKAMAGKAKKKGPYANSLSEGKVKQLSMDLKSGPDGLSDAEFKKKYGKTKSEVRKEMQNKPVLQKKEEPVSEARLEEDDIILVPGQSKRLKSGFVPNGKSRVDHEVEMAKSDLLQLLKNTQIVIGCIKNRTEEDGLEGWVQEKIIKAADYMNTLAEYLEGKSVQEITSGGVIAGGGVGESMDKEELKSKRKELQRIQMDPETSKDPLLKKELARRKAELEKQAADVKEGAKVDRMVKHIEKSERKLGKSKEEAENIAWATANKRGMLDNKNKKKGK